MATPSPVKLIMADHREVERLFERLLAGGRPDPDLVRRLAEELAVHATVEEQVVYPTARDALDDGPELVREAAKEHEEAKRLLAQIERRRGQEEALRQLLGKLRDEVRHHVEEEESEFLPKLERALDGAALSTMANQWERAKAQARGPGSGAGAGEGELLDLTREELYERAKAAGVEGRSKMSKGELAEALRGR